MEYKGVKVNYVQLVSYMGEGFKKNSAKENQLLFKNKIKYGFPYSCSFECPIEDMICINLDWNDGINEDERPALLCALERLKKIFPESFINLNLDDFVEEGNCIDLTGEQFREMYILAD